MAGFKAWATRCTPGLTSITLLLLSTLTLINLNPLWRLLGVTCWISTNDVDENGHLRATWFQHVWIVYAVFIHFMATLFPIRLVRSTHQLTERMEESHARLARGLPLQRGRPTSRVSTDSDKTPESPITPVDYKNEFIISSRELYDPINVILLPCYKEDIENIKFTLKVLASHDSANTNYDVFLAMEQRDPQAVPFAQTLVELFKDRFRDIQYTLHPADMPGEAAGKSSNISWAAREAIFKHKSSPNWKDTLITIMDSDTHLSTDYFKLLESMHKSNRENGVRDVLYMPPIIFDRNAFSIPFLVRVADLMWSGACLSMCGNKSVVSIPTSVYTLPMTLAMRVGGWDTGPDAIGEDMHMMLKCYFGTSGNLEMQVIPSPASQCNVSSSLGGLRGWIACLKARYFQGLRHMWGALDTGFSINLFSEMRRRGEEEEPSYYSTDYSENTRSTSLKSSASSETLVSDNEQSPAPTTKLIHTPEPQRVSRWYRTMTVFYRLFEAHMLPLHMAVVLIASTVYGNLVPTEKQPSEMIIGLLLMSIMRTIAFFLMVSHFVYFYNRYHRLAVERREAEIKRAGLYDDCDIETTFCHRSFRNWRCWIDCVAFVVGGFMFGSIPALHAVTGHFFTTRLDYVVSGKPKQKAAPEPEKVV